MKTQQRVLGTTPLLIVSATIFTLLFIALVSQNRPKYEDIFHIGRRPFRDTFPRTDLKEAGQIKGIKLWDALIPSFTCPNSSLFRVGKDGDGGKWTCGINHLGKVSMKSDQSSSCIVYSFGVYGDSSFEADVMSSSFCQVFAYDPTVNKIAPPLRPTNPRIRFQKIGIGGNDSTKLLTLKTMMLENGGHQWIDILKMDAEAAEYASLNNILDTFEEIPFGQLLIEFHLTNPKRSQSIISLIDRIERKGLRMFSKEKNPLCSGCCEFSFINTKSLELFMDYEEIQKMVDSR